MKKLLHHLLLAVALTGLGFALPSCTTPPDARHVQYQSLQAVGLSAKAGMDSATELLAQRVITVAQWQRVADFYDLKFQPVFSLAVAAAQADLSSAASPDVAALAGQFLTLVAELSTKPKP